MKSELEGTQAAFKEYKEAQLQEDIRNKQVRAAEEVCLMREDNDRLNKELAAKLSELDIIRAFPSSSAYCKKLNDKAAEKIFTIWTVASKYLADSRMGLFECLHLIPNMLLHHRLLLLKSYPLHILLGVFSTPL